MTDTWQNFVQIATDVGRILSPLLQLVVHWLLLIVWLAWWLWCVNWRRVWPVLAEGAWAPVVLLIVIASLGWSQIAPRPLTIPGVGTLPNFWWQLSAVASLAGLTLFCGWLQGVFGWAPEEQAAAPAEAHGHRHDHAHGHDHVHGHGHH